MRRLPAMLGLIALAGCGTPPAPTETPPAAPTVVAAAEPVAVMGAAGCSARGCHGGPASVDQKGQLDAGWGNAYTVWARYDKHTQAYHALQGELAREMIARLQARQPDGKWQNAIEEARCLACHVTPVLANRPSPLHAEGVSCDACHTTPGGKTSDWYELHKTGSQAALNECYEKRGMRRFETAVERAKTCAQCHVGTPSGEVTHDMIAVGHPRLNFEYLTYLDLMPRHWKKRHDDEDGVGAWYGGQTAKLLAGMNLPLLRSNGPPELADWHCFACHHDLAPPGAGNRPRYESLQNVGRPSDPLRQVLLVLKQN